MKVRSQCRWHALLDDPLSQGGRQLARRLSEGGLQTEEWPVPWGSHRLNN